MKFFADTAEIAEIRELAETGLLDGVTTNPSLIHKSGRDFLEVVGEIAGVVGTGGPLDLPAEPPLDNRALLDVPVVSLIRDDVRDPSTR